MPHGDGSAIEHGARRELGNRGRLARAGRAREQKRCSAGERERLEAKRLVQGLAQGGEGVVVGRGRGEIEQPGAKSLREFMMGGHGGEALDGARGPARRRQQLGQIQILVLDRAGDPDATVGELLGRDDDRIGAELRAQHGHGLLGIGRHERLEPHDDEAGSHLTEGPDPGLGMNLVLRQNYRGRPETLDDRADVGAHAGGRDQNRQLAAHRLLLEDLAQAADEGLQLAWRHCQLALVAQAD